jgi:hypothetical protein
LNPTTPALMLIRCGRAWKLLRTAKGNPDVAQWREPTRRAKCLFMFASRQATLKHAREHQLIWMTVW